jgi:hypothetical protein
MFVTTANTLRMPQPLLDRMEIIRLSGYTEEEKIEIARGHLIRKQEEMHGLKKGEWSITDEGLRDLIRYYTREAGVRNLEREIAGLARKAVYGGKSRQDFLQWMLGISYGGESLAIEADEEALRRFSLTGRDFITVHNGFDPNFIISGQRATKCYPHFDAAVAGLKAARPGLLIVQLGTKTSEAIAAADLNLIGRTSLTEAAALLRATRLHLDNEGGLVHLAACYGRRSLVVFGPTPSDYFGYSSNINVDPPRCGGCWWIEESWMDRCPRGMKQPECMFAQPPDKLISLALEALQTQA